MNPSDFVRALRAAAPWQRLRQAAALHSARDAANLPARVAGPVAAPAQRRIHVRPEDFHVTRFRQLGQTTTVFVVDASGSSALHRLAEAKGAVELLLADCYVRRDSVAVLAFRGQTAELILPPTRSLARAKRSLASLPGGGGTPLAHAIDASMLLAGTFGPNDLDNTFGPEVRFIKAPGSGNQNLPPSAGMQFFGHVRIDGAGTVLPAL